MTKKFTKKAVCLFAAFAASSAASISATSITPPP